MFLFFVVYLVSQVCTITPRKLSCSLSVFDFILQPYQFWFLLTFTSKIHINEYFKLTADLENMTSAERISILQEKLQEIRKHYLSLKSEVASIDRRRKRLKKKERESKYFSLRYKSVQCTAVEERLSMFLWTNFTLSASSDRTSQCPLMELTVHPQSEGRQAWWVLTEWQMAAVLALRRQRQQEWEARSTWARPCLPKKKFQYNT